MKGGRSAQSITKQQFKAIPATKRCHVFTPTVPTLKLVPCILSMCPELWQGHRTAASNKRDASIRMGAMTVSPNSAPTSAWPFCPLCRLKLIQDKTPFGAVFLRTSWTIQQNICTGLLDVLALAVIWWEQAAGLCSNHTATVSCPVRRHPACVTTNNTGRTCSCHPQRRAGASKPSVQLFKLGAAAFAC